ncbi:Os02g0510400, partial [Oryza sativa Japonica Group]
DRLAQGFTGLLQAQPPQFPWPADSLRDRPPRGPLRRLLGCPGREGVLPRRGRRLRHRHRQEARPGWRRDWGVRGKCIIQEMVFKQASILTGSSQGPRCSSPRASSASV